MAATHPVANTLTFILAGGEGKRLYPLTADQPKPIVPFGGVFRIIDFTLSNLLNSGLRRIYALTQYKHDRLNSYVRDGWPQLSKEFRWDDGEDIMCLPPRFGRRYRGTADAVFQNLDLIEKSRADSVLIVSADHIYHMDYGALLHRHAESGADLTIAAVPYPIRLAASLGVVVADAGGHAVGFEEKPVSPRPMPFNPDQALVNMGVYVFRVAALVEILRILRNRGDIERRDDFGRDIVPALVGSGRADVFQFDGYWRDVGTLDAYYQSSLDLLLAGAALDPYENAAWPTRTLSGPKSLQRSRLVSDSRVSVDATLAGCEVWMSVVSSGVRIDEDAELEGTIVMPGAHIGSRAKIRNTIITEKTVVPPDARIGYDREADRSRFSVSESGIVIVSGAEPILERTPWLAARPLSKAAGSIKLVRPRRQISRQAG